jgi:hypothetical protein
MAPPINIEQLVSALSDSKVADALAKSFENVLNKRLVSIENSLQTLLTDLRKRDEEITALHEENATLRAEIVVQDKRIQDLESYSRIDNLIIHGLPESYAGVTASTTANDAGTESSMESETIFLDLCKKKLKLPNMSANDISVCHRLKKGSRDRYRPMIVRFTSRKARSQVLAARKELRSSNVYINEHLIKPTADMFASTRQLLKQNKIAGTWTWNCKLYVKLLDGRIRMISDRQEICQLT